MKLLSLHINNYGKFSNYDLNFDDLTSICENNGFGKSTLSSFIKAMFYGLDKVTSSSTKFLDRKHYLPFKGGIFGGNIEFEYNGKIYRIERTFDSKSNTKDTMNVYCNNTQDNNCLGEIPGNTVFGINRDSFERLISINSDKITIETDDDINKKLNNYVENIGEDFDIEVVKKKIKDTTKNNEKRIKELKENIKNLDLEISEKESKKDNLDKILYDKLNAAQVLKNEAEKKYEEAAGLGALVEKWKNYKQMVFDLKDKTNEKKKIESEYSKIPSSEMIKDAKLVDKRITSLNEIIQNSNISDQQLSNYESLKKCFKNKPDEDTLNDISKKIKKYNQLEINVNNYEEIDETEEEKELNRHFYGESIDSLKEVQKELEKDINAYIEEKEKSKPVVVQNINQSNPLSKGALIIGFLLLVVGFIFLFINTTVGFALIILGVLGLFGSLYLKVNNNQVVSPVESTLNIKETKLKAQIVNRFANFKYNGDNPEVLLNQFNNDLKAYERVLKTNKDREKLYNLSLNELKTIEKDLEDFFKSYSINNSDFSKSFEELNNKLTKFINLEEIVNDNIKSNKEAKKEMDDFIDKLSKFRKEYGISSNKSFDDVEIDINNINRLNKEIEEYSLKIEKFRIDNDLTEEPKEVNINLEDLKISRDEVIENFNRIKQEVELIEEDIANLDDLKNEYEEDKELLNSLNDKDYLYKALSSELDNADQKLKDKYIAPIKGKFESYAKLLESAIGDRVKMDKDYKISFEREGEYRTYEHLSNGNLTLCALCFRLAILDNMFEDEFPFILMDDPFVHLDSEHFDKTKKLIEELSKDKQIIYFCCHKSREL